MRKLTICIDNASPLRGLALYQWELYKNLLHPHFWKKMGFTLQALTSNLWSGQGIGFPVSFISLLISFLEEKVALFHFSWNNFLTKFLFLFIWHLLDEFVFSFGISTIWNYQIRILVHHNQSKSKCFCRNPIFAIGTVSILGVTLV